MSHRNRFKQRTIEGHDVQCVLEMLVDLHDCSLVTASVAVVWS